MAALVSSAAFTLSAPLLAQVEVVDLTAQAQQENTQSQNPSPASSQSELFYQMQLLQQEVMELRGIVEEQKYQLQRLKQQSMERYIDLDRRIAAGGSASPAPAPSASPKVAPTSAAVLPDVLPGEKEAYGRAYGLVTSKQFESAVEAFKQFLVDYPGGRYAGNSYYWLGELYQVVNPQDLEAARQAFTQLLEQFPNHAKVPDAMYKLGKVYYLKGNKDKAAYWLEKVVAEHGGGANSAADKAAQFLKSNF